MTSVALNTQQNITNNHAPSRTTFNLPDPAGGVGGSRAAGDARRAQEGRPAGGPSVVAQATGAQPASSSAISSSSYTHYLQQGARTFPHGTERAGADVAQTALGNVKPLGENLASQTRSLDATLQQVRDTPTLPPEQRASLERTLTNARTATVTAGTELNRTAENYRAGGGQSSSPETRKAFASASQGAERATHQATNATASAREELRLHGRQQAHAAQETATRQTQTDTARQTLASGAQPAARSNPQATLAAADGILAMRRDETGRLSNDTLPTGVDNRRVSWETGGVPLSEVAARVDTLHASNAAGRQERLDRLDAMTQHHERQAPGSSKTPGTPGWETANLAANLRAAGAQSDATRASLRNAVAETANGAPRHDVNPVAFQLSRATEAARWEAQLQHDTDQAVQNPSETPATNIAQARARVATMTDTFQNPGARPLHGDGVIQAQAATTRDILTHRRNEMAELGRSLDADGKQPVAGDPAPGTEG
ncbi:MAG TPA: hypothetical protein VEA41_13155, partial [Salinarimonas sp.]|nr:hypothetical protein [Salinarimonas sp.]